MPKLIIDQRPIEVADGTKVIAAAEQLGIMIPRFCYHPGLGSFGACRMCAVKFLEGPVKGVEMSCMVEARDGMVVSTTDPEAVDFRRYVIEWLMLNHPHDCPVCDEGGECLLQDETVSGGHGLRRYLGSKRTYHDQYLGPLIAHEMNRCIHCWRCRNFYQAFAGYRDLGAMQIANRMYFGRAVDGTLESPFAGNLVDICPTGVYTDKPSRFRVRRWDLSRTPSLCLHCSLGCSTVANARYREVLRVEARFSEKVNGYFICDRGRYGFAYANHPDRPRRARVEDQEVTLGQAVQAAAARLAQITRDSGPGAVAAWGSCRSSLATMARLARLCQGQGWPEPQFFPDASRERKVKSAFARLDAQVAVSLREIETADFLLVVGADPVNEAPMLALALRQATRQGGTVAVLDPRPVALPLPFEHLPVMPGEINRCFGLLVKAALSRAAAEGRFEAAAAQFFNAIPVDYAADGPCQDRLVALGQRLRESNRPVVICGTDIVREYTPILAADLVRLLKAMNPQAGLFYLFPGANAAGAALVTGQTEEEGQPPANNHLVEAMEQGTVKALVLVENNPYWHCPDEARLARALGRLELLVVLDYLSSPAVQQAHIVLPTTTLFEDVGAGFVNQEGRLQYAAPVHLGGTPLPQVSGGGHPPRTFLDYVPGGEPRPGGEILPGLEAALAGEPRPQEDWWAWLARLRPWLPAVPPGDGARLLPEQSPVAPYVIKGPEEEASPALEELELLPVDWTFGTEELSASSPYLQAVEQAPRVLLHEQDAARLGLVSGEPVTVKLPAGALTLKLQTAANMAPGVLVLPRHRQVSWRLLPGGPVFLPENAITREPPGS